MGILFSRAAKTNFHDKYVLCEKVGVGTFGQVHLATPLKEDANDHIKSHAVAVKIIEKIGKERTVSSDREMQRALSTEVDIWRRVGSDENCVCFHDVFFSLGLCYMVMERCDNDFLNHIETMPVFDERSLGDVFAQMLSAIRHLHSVRIIHRDVKPDNFVVGGKDGKTLKLGDFGLSVTKSRWKNVFGACGTAPFMCPEMVNEQCYDEKADVWSFGVIVYTLLFGALPYTTYSRSSKAMMNAIARARPAPKFKVVSQSVSQFECDRSVDAMAFAKRLLTRDARQRPSALEASSMVYMNSVAKRCHLLSVNAPSLRPMIRLAKRAGLFALRDQRKLCSPCAKESGQQSGKLVIPWHSNCVRL
jgi:serine/threonine protein kinase